MNTWPKSLIVEQTFEGAQNVNWGSSNQIMTSTEIRSLGLPALSAELCRIPSDLKRFTIDAMK